MLTPEYPRILERIHVGGRGIRVKWRAGTVTTSVKVTNLLNRTIQQHVFGDLLRRTVFAELKLRM